MHLCFDPFGFDKARGDAVDIDIVLRPLLGHRLGEVNDCRLGRAKGFRIGPLCTKVPVY